MNKYSTHLIQNYDDPNKGSALSRTADGMIIGRRVGNMIAYGEGPRNQQQHVFISELAAQAAFRKVADADQRAQNDESRKWANIEEVPGDKRIIAAGGVN